jgi:hypothetical protein
VTDSLEFRWVGFFLEQRETRWADFFIEQTAPASEGGRYKYNTMGAAVEPDLQQIS